jgi:hypothetical protein
MKNMPPSIPYTVSAVDIVRLLWFNIGNDTHFTDSTSQKIKKVHRSFEGECFLSTSKCRT